MTDHPGDEIVECMHCDRVFTDAEIEKAAKGLKPPKPETRELWCPRCHLITPQIMEIQ